MKKFIPLIWIVAFSVVMGIAIVKDESPIGDTIVLLRDGEARKSSMRKTGAYCSVGWYRSIEDLLLRRDGTIYNSTWKYKWTLHEWGAEQDQKWFDANCKEPPR